MFEALSQMLWPLLACFVLVGIHAYLGIHVIARKVIFVDLALAQIAALGAVYGVFIGLSFETNSLWIKAVSVTFTLLGALLFSFTRTPDERVPHEAIIGIIYAAALSMTLLLTANLPHGGDEVRQMLAGNILWVTPNEVIYTAVLYGAVGIVHVIFRKQFFLLSSSGTIKNQRTWDFLFYATFGVVVTSSVSMGGVLLVFGYLVIPSVIGVIYGNKTISRLLISWASGLSMSLVGVIISYYLDLPSGPTIVVLLGLLLILMVLLREIKKTSTRRAGLLHMGLILVVGTFLAIIPMLYRHLVQEEHEHVAPHENKEQIEMIRHALRAHNDEEIISALMHIKEKNLVSLFSDVLPFLISHDDKQRVLAIDVLSHLDKEKSRAPLKEAASKEKDVFIKIDIAEALLSIGDKDGLFILLGIITEDNSQLVKDDALGHLKDWLLDAPDQPSALSSWLHKNRDRITYDETRRKYKKI